MAMRLAISKLQHCKFVYLLTVIDFIWICINELLLRCLDYEILTQYKGFIISSTSAWETVHLPMFLAGWYLFLPEYVHDELIISHLVMMYSFILVITFLSLLILCFTTRFLLKKIKVCF